MYRSEGERTTAPNGLKYFCAFVFARRGGQGPCLAMTERKILNIFLDENKKPSIVQRVKFHPATVEFVKKN